MSTFAEAADRLVRLGYHVFQLQPGTKLPFVQTAPSGCNSATGDPDVVRTWWTQYPDCNIGLKCENVLVIDVDNKNGRDGNGDFKKIVDRVGPLTTGPVSRSGNGGYHLLFQKPDIDLKSTKGLKWDGQKTAIDIQVGNQYITVPPSIHPDTGREYCWQAPLCAVNELPKLPEDWINHVLPHRTPQIIVPEQPKLVLPTNDSGMSPADRCRLYLEQVPVCVAGQGGDTQLFVAANVIFWDFGLSEAEGRPLLQEYNARCLPPWPQHRLDHKMREALKPENHNQPRGHKFHETKVPPMVPGVDISGITDNFARPREPEEPGESDDEDIFVAETLLDDPGAVPDHLLRIPGFVSEVMDFSLANAPCAVPTTAFCGALALQSFLCGRKVREPGDLRTNLYLLALVGASSGKDFPRKVNTHVIEQIGDIMALGDKFVSGEGLQDSLFIQPNMLYQNDEIDELLFKLNDRNRSAHVESIMGTLLTLYTSASTIYPMRRKSGKEHPGVIDQPHLTVLGTATPQFYYGALSERMMSNGFFARMVIVDADKRPFTQDAGLVSQISERVLETARWWRAFQPGEMKGNLGKFHPTPITIPFDDKSVSFMRDFRRFADEEYSKAEDKGDVVSMTVWGRANENARKLALLYACSADHQKPEIMLPATQWASEFVTHQIRRQLAKAKEYSSKTKFQALCKEALRHVRQWHRTHGKRGMPYWVLRRHLGVMPREFCDLLQELEAQRHITIERIATKGRPQELVSLVQR